MPCSELFHLSICQSMNYREDVGFCVGFVAVRLFSASSLAEVRITCCTLFGTCHDFQTRGVKRLYLRVSYAPMDWQFRVSHYGLFLGFEMIFVFLTLTFDV